MCGLPMARSRRPMCRRQRGAFLLLTPAEPVDAEAKELAAKQLSKLAARNAAKQAVAAKAKPKTKTKPAPETPAQLRARVRAGLLRRPTPPVRKLRG